MGPTLARFCPSLSDNATTLSHGLPAILPSSAHYASRQRAMSMPFNKTAPMTRAIPWLVLGSSPEPACRSVENHHG